MDGLEAEEGGNKEEMVRPYLFSAGHHLRASQSERRLFIESVKERRYQDQQLCLHRRNRPHLVGRQIQNQESDVNSCPIRH